MKPSLGALLSDSILAVGAFPLDTETKPGYKQGGIKKFLLLPVGLLAPTTFNSKVFYLKLYFKLREENEAVFKGSRVLSFK